MVGAAATNPTQAAQSYAAAHGTHSYNRQNEDDDELALVEHKFVLDVDKANRETVDRDRNFYDALESSKWLPIELLETF